MFDGANNALMCKKLNTLVLHVLVVRDFAWRSYGVRATVCMLK